MKKEIIEGRYGLTLYSSFISMFYSDGHETFPYVNLGIMKIVSGDMFIWHFLTFPGFSEQNEIFLWPLFTKCWSNSSIWILNVYQQFFIISRITNIWLSFVHNEVIWNQWNQVLRYLKSLLTLSDEICEIILVMTWNHVVDDDILKSWLHSIQMLGTSCQNVAIWHATEWIGLLARLINLNI